MYEEIESIFPIRHFREETDVEHSSNKSWNPSAATTARLEYITIHLECLKATIAVLLQALNTVQIILWARYDITYYLRTVWQILISCQNKANNFATAIRKSRFE